MAVPGALELVSGARITLSSQLRGGKVGGMGGEAVGFGWHKTEWD